VGRYTALVDGIVVGYGGTVDKHIGDAVMALFGAPRAHDDDPMRAARAALDIHEALGRMSVHTIRPLQAHVGIASGEVVAGILGRAEASDYTVLGDSVNLAARLVAAAGPGETLLSDGVYRALSGRGVCDALGEIQLKGFEAPTRAWRLRGLSAEPLVATRSAFVGREAELEQFKSILSACPVGGPVKSSMCAARRVSAKRDWSRRCAVSPRPRASLLIAALYSISELAKDRTRSALCS
jgi:hypothetical protein